MDDPLFLGVDGGGSGCRARLIDAAGRTLGEGRSGSANPGQGLAAARAAVVAAAVQTLRQARLAPSAIERVHAGLGLAGVNRASERQRFEDWDHPFAALTLETDAFIACLGAHGGGEGAIILSGTGSCGLMFYDGRVMRIGGWGFPISDQASGAWIGLEAIRCSLLAHDAVVPSSELSRAILQRFGDDPDRIAAWQAVARPGDFAALASLVLVSANRGDPLATAIVREAASNLHALARTLWMAGAPRLTILGSVGEALLPLLPDEAKRRLSAPLSDAMDGAIEMARWAAAGS